MTALMGGMLALAGLGAYLAQAHLAYEPRQAEQPTVVITHEAPPQTRSQPGALPPFETPRQGKIAPQEVDLGQGFTGRIHHSYEVAGYVLTRRLFTRDGLAPVSPLDLGIGWGRLMDPEERAKFSFKPGKRNIRWRGRDRDSEAGRNPLDLVTQLSNNHLLPSSEAVRTQLLAIEPGMVVHLTGYLIDVTTPKGARWRSSTKRTDYNLRGCEVILVTRVAVIGADEMAAAAAAPISQFR